MSLKTCPECGSTELIEQGVYAHGTRIRKLRCLTCAGCSTILAVAEGLREEDPLSA